MRVRRQPQGVTRSGMPWWLVIAAFVCAPATLLAAPSDAGKSTAGGDKHSRDALTPGTRVQGSPVKAIPTDISTLSRRNRAAMLRSSKAKTHQTLGGGTDISAETSSGQSAAQAKKSSKPGGIRALSEKTIIEKRQKLLSGERVYKRVIHKRPDDDRRAATQTDPKASDQNGSHEDGR